MLKRVQIVEEDGEPSFAVIPYDEYVTIKSMLSDEEKLADYLDVLHMQNVKAESSTRYSLAEVRAVLGLD